MKLRWKALVASIVTYGLVTVIGVLFLFQPITAGDTVGEPWPPAIAIATYLVLSVLLLDWAACRTGSSWAAAIVIGSAQLIFIVDLLARGERGLKTAIAGALLVALSWAAVAFVHDRLTRKDGGR